jgi:two-component system chemotaxis response regulator CheB
MNMMAKIAEAEGAVPIGPRPRLLVVDDSVVIRSAIERIVASQGEMVVTAKVATIESAIAYLRKNKVELILLDHELPGTRGIDALPDILAAAEGARVAILSGHCAAGSDAAIRALALGASDVISKPGIRDYDAGFGELLVRRLTRLAMPAMMSNCDQAGVKLKPVPSGFRLTCLGIGASTGGIHALSRLLAGHDLKLGVPLLVTQHLPETFIPYFSTQLARMTGTPVKIAEQGEPLRANHIYIAPGHANLLCARGAHGVPIVELKAQRATPLDPLPSLNPMFTAMAQTFGNGAAGIVLTGMGRDGTIGARAIAAAGGLVIAQDRESSVVWGMPGAVAQAGTASALLPPDKMIEYLNAVSGVAQ